ncbi:MAG: glycine oxidase ThiO [Microlunatus sp.]|nr:glycine oxidase ThiO [Microlunatus sp.]MDN5769807.1 glycine oxidase ThiO [Microlunatus sp.]MDN5803914.1 glycine oxidase ThiO [Microlunatus sp.]
MPEASSDRVTADVVVIGGGLIGAASAWRLAVAGLDVAVVVGEPGAGASRVAAGMLAPVSETTFTEEALLALNLASMRRYPEFVAEVSQASGLPSGFRPGPTISVAYNADDAARLGVLADYLSRLGLESQRLTSREARGVEPLLAPTIRGGLLVPGDASCDNRVLLDALAVAGDRAGVRTVPGFVHHVVTAADRVTGVVLADGSPITAGAVVLANGAWAGQITGIPPVPVRPIKGQILRLDPGRFPQPGVVVRAFTRGTEVYLVPRDGGRELVVGATVEELGFDHRVTAGGVYELLRDARLAVPMSSEYVLAETSVGYRPGTPDNAPVLGHGGMDGLVLATGHYRNGVLLTPVTADIVAEVVLHDRVPAVAEPFGLARFVRSLQIGVASELKETHT